MSARETVKPAIGTATTALGANAMRPARHAPTVDEILHFRHDVTTGNAVESPVRVAGGFPTLGGGLRGGRAGDARLGVHGSTVSSVAVAVGVRSSLATSELVTAKGAAV